MTIDFLFEIFDISGVNSITAHNFRPDNAPPPMEHKTDIFEESANSKIDM